MTDTSTPLAARLLAARRGGTPDPGAGAPPVPRDATAAMAVQAEVARALGESAGRLEGRHRRRRRALRRAAVRLGDSRLARAAAAGQPPPDRDGDRGPAAARPAARALPPRRDPGRRRRSAGRHRGAARPAGRAPGGAFPGLPRGQRRQPRLRKRRRHPVVRRPGPHHAALPPRRRRRGRPREGGRAIRRATRSSRSAPTSSARTIASAACAPGIS